MASKSPNKHWKTANWMASGQLKTLEKEQADLLKSFSRHLSELEGYLTQNKTMTAEGAYRCFFETYDNLEDNRQQQSNARSHYQELIKQYRLSKDCGNQTSLVSSTLAGDKDPNDKTVIDTGNGAIENAEENAEVSSKHSATYGSRKQPSIDNSRSSKRRQIEEMELENLRARKETEQRLR